MTELVKEGRGHMTLREMYDDIGGNYEEVINRLGGARGESLLFKLMGMLPHDTSMEDLHRALETKDYELAFRAAHTYKGIVMNLGLGPLVDTAKELTECLREGKEDERIIPLYEELEKWNQRVLQDITKLTEV